MNNIINNFYTIDYILLVISILFIFFSVWKGFINSILGLMTWVGSIIITLVFYEQLSNYLSNYISKIDFFEKTGLSEIIATISSIPIIFFLSLIILRKIKKLITSDLDKATFGVILDKFFGIIYGLFFSYFIFSIFLFLIDKINTNLLLNLIDNSNIFLLINFFNENYILNNIPFLLESVDQKIN
tara:strand:+ start:214 stop:768 length:555 start_codon:yes stop_codon:yes gene_type:complete